MSMITNIGLKAMIPGMWCIVAALLPFAAFQWFGFAAFCKLQKHELSNFPASISDYGTKLNLTMPGSDSKPEWCSSDPPIPFLALGIFPPNFECWKFLLENNSFFFSIGKVLEWREPFSHWVPDDWPQYIAWAPAMVLILWQVGHFVKIHKRYCMRLGLVDNTLLGMAKPKMAPWSLSRYKS